MSDPPNINITQRRIKLLHAGYLPLPVNGKAPSLDEWQTKTDVSADEVRSWGTFYSYAPSTGLLTKLMPTFDIDILTPEAAQAIEELIRERFAPRGRILVRVGRAPKRAIPFRTDTPFPKITANVIAPDGSAGQKIEFLGDGQQVVAFGIHEDTHQPYQWHGGEPGECKYGALPNITEAEAQALVDDAARLLCNQYGFQPAAAKPANGSGSPEHWAVLLANIQNGDALHDSTRDLAAKMIVSGMGSGAVTNMLRAQMDISPAPHDARWQERRDDIPRAVKSAEKFVAGALEAADAPLPFINIAAWHGAPVPEREWVVRGRVPLKNVTILSGEGGVGKSILTLQLAVATALGNDWLNVIPEPGPVFIFCAEDDQDELHRRLDRIADYYGTDFKELSTKMQIVSFAGEDAVLAAPNSKGIIEPTKVFRRVRSAVCDTRPRLIIIDNSADVFAGNENDRAQVRQFITMLRGMTIAANAGLVLTSHPSLTGIATGTGRSGSTGWENSVRSRLYFIKAKTEKDEEPDPDLRVLQVMKSNYGPAGETITLRWSDGLYLPAAAGEVQTLAQAEAAAEADGEFMRMLDHSIEKVSLLPKANNYAPKVFSDDIRCKLRGRQGKKALADAMGRLLANSTIATAEYGPPSNRRERVVRAVLAGTQAGPK